VVQIHHQEQGFRAISKTFSALDAYGLTIITSVTGQNTSNFGMVEPVSKNILEKSIRISNFRF
jgi:Hydroxymethylpyrimidine/phosphomethylpyrimidine kinase